MPFRRSVGWFLAAEEEDDDAAEAAAEEDEDEGEDDALSLSGTSYHSAASAFGPERWPEAHL